MLERVGSLIIVVVALFAFGCVDVQCGGGPAGVETDPAIIQALQQHEQKIQGLAKQVMVDRGRQQPTLPPTPPGKGFREAMEKAPAAPPQGEQKPEAKDQK